jgi:hypothetical protein
VTVFKWFAKACCDGVQSAFLLMPAALGRRSGSQLLSWTQDAVVAVPRALPEPKPKSKHSLLPVLIVLFLVSYGLMSLLAVEQDRTIASQRSLITSLLNDSTELSSLKGKVLQKQYAQAQAQAGAGARSQAQSPSFPAPMIQVPMNQVPMTQDATGGSAQSSHNGGKVKKPVPPRPPLGIADIVDGRRIVKTI